jgi:hypothetical protein
MQVVLKEQKKNLDLDNIFGVPIREKKVLTVVKRACSSVRNAFRQDVRRTSSLTVPSTEYFIRYVTASIPLPLLP